MALECITWHLKFRDVWYRPVAILGPVSPPPDDLEKATVSPVGAPDKILIQINTYSNSKFK
jgi:hypothetical protein